MEPYELERRRECRRVHIKEDQATEKRRENHRKNTKNYQKPERRRVFSREYRKTEKVREGVRLTDGKRKIEKGKRSEKLTDARKYYKRTLRKSHQQAQLIWETQCGSLEQQRSQVSTFTVNL